MLHHDDAEQNPSRYATSIWPGVQNLLLAARASGLEAVPTTYALAHRDELESALELPNASACRRSSRSAVRFEAWVTLGSEQMTVCLESGRRPREHWRFGVGVTSRVIDNIRAMISSGELSPGDRLPPEHELADRLGVSRGSLREAVRALSQIKVLDVRRGDGTYVTSLAPSELLSGLAFAVELLQPQGLEEVLEVRRLLLPSAAALAAQRVTQEQVAEMHAVVDQLEVATDPDEIARLHRRFQALVGDATGNETLSSILHALQLRGENVRRAWLSSDPANRDVALAHQRMLLDALERRDSDMAKSIATVQVDERRRWIEHLRNTRPARPDDAASAHVAGDDRGPATTDSTTSPASHEPIRSTHRSNAARSRR